MTEDEELLRESGTFSFLLSTGQSSFQDSKEGLEKLTLDPIWGFFYQLVARFAQEQVLPKVAKMDETEQLDKDVLKGLFEQGVRFQTSA